MSALEARIHELLAGISETDSSQMCIYSPDFSPEWHTPSYQLSWMADRLLPVPASPPPQSQHLLPGPVLQPPRRPSPHQTPSDLFKT